MTRLDRGISPNPNDSEFQTSAYRVSVQAQSFYQEQGTVRLIQNPGLNLDPYIEIPEYFKRQTPHVLESLKRIMQQLGMTEPMDSKCDVIVGIDATTLENAGNIHQYDEKLLRLVNRSKNGYQRVVALAE